MDSDGIIQCMANLRYRNVEVVSSFLPLPPMKYLSFFFFILDTRTVRTQTY